MFGGEGFKLVGGRCVDVNLFGVNGDNDGLLFVIFGDGFDISFVS